MDNVNQPAAGASKTGMWVALIIAVVVLGVGAYFLFGRDSGTNSNNSNVVVNNNTNTTVNQNLNASANTNSISNANENTNTDSNTNTQVDTTGWEMYDSSTSMTGIFQQLDPAFVVSYPPGANVEEELGGLIIGENPRSTGGATVEISRISEFLEDDIVDSCKKHVPWTNDKEGVGYDYTGTLDVAGIKSAYLVAQLPDFDGRLDPVFACVPHESGFDLITGQPRTSEFVISYFDAILATYNLKR